VTVTAKDTLPAVEASFKAMVATPLPAQLLVPCSNDGLLARFSKAVLHK